MFFLKKKKNCSILLDLRRKFRSQTSDNMDRWKSRGGKSQRREEKRREEKKREDQRRERVRRKKMQVREKVERSRFTVFFPMICGSGGSKSRRRVRSHVARWEIKNCTPLWREAHFEVKSGKNCGFGALLDVRMSFWVVGTRDSAPCQKFAKREGFVAVSTTTTTLTLHSTPTTATTTATTTITTTTTTTTTTTLHFTTLHCTTQITLLTHYTALQYTQLQYTQLQLQLQLHYTTLHYTNYNCSDNYN